MAFRPFRRLRDLLDVDVSSVSDGDALVYDQGADEWVPGTAGGGGAPTTVDYLVGTASGDLSAEIVAGTAPGGELGGTWASPTVDATHSGSSHAGVQAAAEATAAAALAAHEADTTNVHGIAAAVGGVEWTVVTKGSDEQVSSSTTIQNDDALFFTAVSGAMYEIELYIIYGSPAGGTTPGYKASYGEDTTARGTGWVQGFNTAGTAAIAGTVSFNQTFSDTHQTDTTDRAYRIAGWHRGNGGTWRVQWAQQASDSNATIVRAGSVIRYRRIV